MQDQPTSAWSAILWFMLSNLKLMRSPEGQFPTPVPNAVFDIAFSEAVPDLVATAGGDGFLRVDFIQQVY